MPDMPDTPGSSASASAPRSKLSPLAADASLSQHPSPRTGRNDARATAPLRLALTPDEAAAALGVSRDLLDEHVMPELRVVRVGRRRLVPLKELESWLDDSAAFAAGGGR